MKKNFSQHQNKIVFKSNFSQHLRAVGDIHSEVDIQFKSGLPTFGTEQSFRKYYGKKVKKLVHLSRLSDIYARGRCKVLRSLWIYSSAQKVLASRSVKHLRITHFSSLFGNFEQMGQTSAKTPFLRKMSNYKSLQSLEMKTEMVNGISVPSVFYKQIRTLNQLQFLFLAVYEDQLIQNSNHILSIKQLKSVDLKPFGCYSMQNDDYVTDALDFYTKLINLKNIEFVRLDLQESVYMKKSVNINSLLQQLSEDERDHLAFDIQLKISLYDMINFEFFQNILDKADLFCWSCSSSSSISMWSDTIHSKNVKLDQAKRRLGLNLMPTFLRSFSYKPQGENLSKTNLERFNILKNMMQEFFGVSIASIPHLDRLNDFRSVSFDFGAVSEPQARINSLLSILKQSNSLENLTLRNVAFQGKKVTEAPSEEILSLMHLKGLEIRDCTIPYDSMSLFISHLSTFTNLEKLHLDIKPSDLAISNTEIAFTFPELIRLTDLSCQFNWVLLEHGINFLKILKKLVHLKKLKLSWGSQLLRVERFRLMLLESIPALLELEEVEILDDEEVPQQESEVNEKNENMHDINKTAFEIRDYINNLFKENPNLEKFHFCVKCQYDIKYMRY